MNRYPNYLIEYRERIRSGEIIAGMEMIMELDNLIEDLRNPRYTYDTSGANERMDFMENCIRLTKAPFYNQPMKLMLWQKAFIEVVYSFKMVDTGYDRFKKIILLISRKNTKSETCSALADTEFFIGEEGNDIVCSSNDEAQASITYDAIDMMRMLMDPNDLDSKRNQRFLLNKNTNTKITKLSDRTRNKEGRNIGFAIVDETHEMKNNIIAKSIEQSQSLKNNPKFFNITTEGFVNGGYLDEELEKNRKIIRGEADGPMAERTLPWHYTQDSEREIWEDESSWTKSNPTLGVVKKWDYLREQIDAAKTSKSDRVFVLAKDFNIKQSNSQSWLQESEYVNVSTFDLEEFRGCYCLGAVDLAETTDLTCAKILFMKQNDRTKYVYTMYFIPEVKLEQNDDSQYGAKYLEWSQKGLLQILPGVSNDLTLVADWFYSLYVKYEIRLFRCGYDVKFSKDFISRMSDYGFDTELIQQNSEVMSLPMKIVEAELKAKLINYQNNPIDEWCFSNSAIQVNEKRQCMCVRISGQSSRKIDGSVTLIILYATLERYRSAFMDMIKRSD